MQESNPARVAMREQCRCIMLAVVAFMAASGAAKVAGAELEVAKVAVFPLLIEGEPNAAIVQAISESLDSVATVVPDVAVLAGESLRKALKTPFTTLVACREDIRCISKLGKKLGTAEVLVGQARAAGSGVTLTFIAFSSDGALVLRKVRVDVATVAEARTVVANNIYAFLGITTSGAIEISAADADTEIRVDGAVVGRGRGPYQVSPGRHSISVANVAMEVTVRPGKTSVAVLPAAELPLDLSPLPQRAAPASTAPLTKAGGEPKAAPWSTLRWTSVGLLAGSGAAFVVATIYGIKRNAVRDQISPSTPQITADAKTADANRYRDRANTSLLVGGCLFTAGAVLFGLDWYAVAVPPTSGSPGQVQASVTGHF